MQSKLIWGIAVAALTVSPAFAQEVETFGPEAGDWEFQLGAGGSNDNDFESGDFSLDGSLGYYFTENLSGAVRQEGTWVGGREGAEDSWAGSTRIAADYHFDLTEGVRPFIGANLGYVYGEDTQDTWIAGPEAGLKWYVKDETFIFGRAEYLFFFDEADDADEAFDDGQFVYTVGIGFNF